jgi:hypothetical protein
VLSTSFLGVRKVSRPEWDRVLIVAATRVGGHHFFELTKGALRGKVEQASRAGQIVSAEQRQRHREAVTRAQTGEGRCGRVSDGW